MGLRQKRAVALVVCQATQHALCCLDFQAHRGALPEPRVLPAQRWIRAQGRAAGEGVANLGNRRPRAPSMPPACPAPPQTGTRRLSLTGHFMLHEHKYGQHGVEKHPSEHLRCRQPQAGRVKRNRASAASAAAVASRQAWGQGSSGSVEKAWCDASPVS